MSPAAFKPAVFMICILNTGPINPKLVPTTGTYGSRADNADGVCKENRFQVTFILLLDFLGGFLLHPYQNTFSEVRLR